jgi:hypothetical protein
MARIIISRFKGFLSKNMSLAWGAIVVTGISCFGGSIIQGVGGYVGGLCVVLVIDKLMR